MKEIVFDSVLLKDGHLSCPSRLARHNAHYKVIATFPDEDATELDIELASAQDIEGEYLAEKEIQYYLSLKDPR